MQLVALGAQDVFLTGNPQITFFKIVYRRHTNFSKQCMTQLIEKNSCTIPRHGDLIQEMYLTFNVNLIYDIQSIKKKGGLDTPSLSNNTIISRKYFSQQMKNILYNTLGLYDIQGNTSSLISNVRINTQIPHNGYITISSLNQLNIDLSKIYYISFDTDIYFKYNNGPNKSVIAKKSINYELDFSEYSQINKSITLINGLTYELDVTQSSSSSYYIYNVKFKSDYIRNILSLDPDNAGMLTNNNIISTYFTTNINISINSDNDSLNDPNKYGFLISKFYSDNVDIRNTGQLVRFKLKDTLTDIVVNNLPTSTGVDAVNINQWNTVSLNGITSPLSTGYYLQRIISSIAISDTFRIVNINNNDKSFSLQYINGKNNIDDTDLFKIFSPYYALNETAYGFLDIGNMIELEILNISQDLTNTIKDVSIDIGGQQIDKHDSNWLDIYNQLFEKNIDYRINLSQQDITNTKKIYIPLKFWFNRNPGLALPLIALQYHEVKIKFNFSRDDLINPHLLVNYIYLDTDERRRFAQTSHEYLIEQLQINTNEQLVEGHSKVKLIFNHPVKCLFWTTDTGGGVIDNIKLSLNGHDRFSEQEFEYFRYVQPYENKLGNDKMFYPLTRLWYGRNSSFYNYLSRWGPWNTLGIYSFSLDVSNHQPSGTCNFSRIDNAYLHFNTFHDTDYSSTIGNIHIYALNYNVLRIMSGMGGLTYSN